jgi:uncharacterized repeat protein (TIGR01451 family)
MRRAFALLACLVALMLGTARAGAPSADLAIDVAGPSSAEVATTVKLKVAIDNHGPGTAEAPKVTVVLPLGVSYVRPSEDQPACEHASGQIACSLPRLAAPADNGGQSSQVSFTFPVTSPGSGPRTLDANVVTRITGRVRKSSSGCPRYDCFAQRPVVPWQVSDSPLRQSSSDPTQVRC